MLVVKDAMVLIHLAKTTLLEKSCGFFGHVIIPEEVFEEAVTAGLEQGYPDASLIQMLVSGGQIGVKPVTEKGLLERAYQCNIQGGEAGAVALYWQEKADRLASDDDNVRKKGGALDINLIGTPAILLALYRKKLITRQKALEAVKTLKKIGWFSTAVLDMVILEVAHGTGYRDTG